MKIINRQIIVIGTSHHNTLSMVRCFGMAGNRPDLILYGCNSSYVATSKMINNCYCVSTAFCAYELLKTLYWDMEKKPIVISCTDEIESILDTSNEQLTSKFDYFHAKEVGRVTLYMDKYRQAELANKVGIKTPITFSSSDIIPIDSFSSYPYIIKPLESRNGGKKIVVCNNKIQLCDAISDFSTTPFLIQQYLRKEKEYVIVGMTLEDVSYIPACVEKHRETNGATTYSTVRTVAFLPTTLIDGIEQMLKIIGYEGLWGVEVIQHGQDYYFVELNLRNDATTFSVAVAGVNLPLIYATRKDGAEIEYCDSIHEIESMVENRDFQFVLSRKIGFWRWLVQYKKAKCKYIGYQGDNLPFTIERKRILSSIIKSVLHRFHLR